jgi:hypothetical protein
MDRMLGLGIAFPMVGLLLFSFARSWVRIGNRSRNRMYGTHIDDGYGVKHARWGGILMTLFGVVLLAIWAAR